MDESPRNPDPPAGHVYQGVHELYRSLFQSFVVIYCVRSWQVRELASLADGFSHWVVIAALYGHGEPPPFFSTATNCSPPAARLWVSGRRGASSRVCE